MKNSLGPRTMVIGLVVGILSIPALVFGANSLFTSGAETPVNVAERAPVVVATAPTTTTETPTTTTAAPPVTAADLQRACGEDGLGLVAAEADGTVSELEQAALDALRPICEAEGLPLPPPIGPDPVVIVETILAPPADAPTPGDDPTARGDDGAAGDDNGDEDDHDEDHEEDEDHDEDEAHDEDDDHGEDGD